MKENNKGFSLLEFIVVIGIMSVMVAGIAISISTLNGTKASECAQKVSNQLNSTKTGSMSRFDEEMKLSYKTKGASEAVTSDGIYTENTSYTIKQTGERVAVAGSELRKVGDKNVVVKVYLTDGSNYTIAGSTSITISYNRTSGAQDEVIVGNTKQDGVYVDKITFTQGSRTCTIDMTHQTGKHTLNT